MAKLTDSIKDYTRHTYVAPAVERGEQTFTIRVGDIVRDLHLINRTPAVCSALSSKPFLEENNLVLEKREGPPSGLSTTVKFTYRLLRPGQGDLNPSPFLALRGAGKTVFQKLGGGDAFLEKERDKFYGS